MGARFTGGGGGGVGRCGVSRLETAVPTFPSSKGRIRCTMGKAARNPLTKRCTPDGTSIGALDAGLASARPGGRVVLARGDSIWSVGCGAELPDPIGSGEPTARE